MYVWIYVCLFVCMYVMYLLRAVIDNLDPNLVLTLREDRAQSLDHFGHVGPQSRRELRVDEYFIIEGVVRPDQRDLEGSDTGLAPRTPHMHVPVGHAVSHLHTRTSMSVSACLCKVLL